MASNQGTVDFIVEQISGAGTVSAQKMFGEYGIFCDGKIVALVCDDQWFVKTTNAGQEFVGTLPEASPYPGAKPCFRIPKEKLQDREWLAKLVKISAAALPLQKVKSIAKTTR